MVIGEASKIKIYIVRSANTKPTNVNQFIDYTSFFTKWKVQHLLNNLAIFKGTAMANMDGDSPSGSGTRKDDLKRDNFIYVLAGNGTEALISKFIITKPIYDSDYSVNITAVQSSGSEVALKNLYSWNIPKSKYQDETISTIFEGVGTLKGITVDPAAASIISVGSIADGTHRFSLSLDYENRLGALSKACNITRKEWEITHGSNSGVIPFSAGDELNVLNRIGDSTSVKTFYLSGSNENAKPSSGTEETENVANDIIAKGRDMAGNQIQVEIYDGATTKTYITQTIDGWLANDITAIMGTFSLQPGHGLAGLGAIIIKIDSEYLAGSVTGDAFTVTSRGAAVTTYPAITTVPAPHKAGSDTILVEDVSESVFGSSRIIVHVYDDTKLPSPSTTVWVGNEKMAVISKSAGQFVADRYGGLSISWGNAYAHSAPGSVGSDVFSGAIYPYAAESLTGNSIYDNGLISKTMTDNSCLTKDSLEKKAKYMLDSKKNPIERIALNVSDPMDVLTTPVKLGDTVNLQNTDSINITAGDYRVIEYEFNGPFPELILYINDPSIRGWTTGQYDFAQDLDDQETIKQQDPTRASDEQRVSVTDMDGNPLGSWSPGPTSIQDVVVPIDAWGSISPSSYLTNDYDSAAASVGFVRGQIAASAGYWEESGSDIRPIAGYDIISNGGIGSGETIGISLQPWDVGYFSIISCGYYSMGGGWVLQINISNEFNVYNGHDFLSIRPATGGSVPDQIRCDVIFKNYSAAGDVAGLAPSHEGLTYFNTSTGQLRIYDGTVWADVGGTGYWETHSTGIRPNTSGYAVLPNGTSTLGDTSNIWDGLYLSGDIQPSSSTGIRIALSSSYGIYIRRIRDGSGYGITFDTSSNTPAWRVYGGTQNLIINRDAGSGVFQVNSNAVVVGNIYADIAGVYSLGTSTYYYDSVHTQGIHLHPNALIYTASGDDLSIESGDDLFLEADDDIFLQADDDLWLKWDTGGSDFSLRFNSVYVYPSDECLIDFGASDRSWDRGYFQDIYGTTHATECDIAELQFVDKDLEPGHVVELAEWDSDELETFDKEFMECQRKQRLGKSCKIGYYGLQGKWKKASVKSTKCPSIISTQPALCMGDTEIRKEQYGQGKMRYVTLSGSVPNVHVNGDFTSGDILVSAGDGKAMVDNDAPWNQCIGYAKRTGKDERCEIWVR